VACDLELNIPADEVIHARLAARGGNSLLQAITTETASPAAIEEWLVQFWPGPRL
jgi:hypothetical protein